RKLSHNQSITKDDLTEEYILDMAKIYIDNDLPAVSYKIYNQYLELFPNSDNIVMVKNFLSSMHEYKIEEPTEMEDNIFHYKKGYCLYSELRASNYIYLINSGKIGIYNIVNSKLVTRSIYSSNNIIDGYAPDINYQALSTAAVVLEDSKIKLLKKEDVMSMIFNVNSLRLYYLKIVSTKIRNNILKVMALNANDISIKLYITIYYILKTETLFSKEINSVDLLYKVNDIAAIIGYNNAAAVKHELKKINSLSIYDDYIHVLNINNFIKEYETHKKILMSKNYGR
ncbi:cAMP-binding protein, partial [uncultured Brachyspira sp.]|uniref:cAMP-binding protein n=1 Tax=uncultured Brachyspira sp. TaxID=221953 RepID=UPI00263037BC